MDRGGRLRQLNLTIGVSPPDPAEIARIRTLTEERFIRGVLDACEQTVRDTMGSDVLVYVRWIDARWRVEASELDSPSAQMRLGSELGQAVVARVEAQPPGSRLRPRRDAEIAVFEEEAHLRAAYLSAVLDGDEDAWFFRALREEASVWAGACESGTAVVCDLLGWLDVMGTLERAIARLDAESLERVAGMVPVTEWPASTRADRHPRRGRETGGQSTEEGTVTPQAESGQAVASRTRPVAESEPPSRKSVGDEPDTRDPRAAGPETTSGDPVAAMSAAAEDSFRDIGRERPLASPEAVAAVSATAAPPVSAPALGEAPAISATEIAPERATEFVTRFAGLFYLVDVILEIDLAEHLYCAAILEGRFLAHAMALLIGDRDDPAPWLLGGAIDGRPPPLAPIVDWAADEVWLKARGSMAARLHARELPCPFDDELKEEIGGLAKPLVELAASLGHDELTATLLGRCAVILARFFQTRLGEGCDVGAIRTRLVVDGIIKVSAGELLAVMPLGAIAIDLRRAGLDFDPGWTPWLRRKVRVAFRGEGI